MHTKRRKVQFLVVSLLLAVMATMSMAYATVSRQMQSGARVMLKAKPAVVYVDKSSVKITHRIPEHSGDSSFSLKADTMELNFVALLREYGDAATFSLDIVNDGAVPVRLLSAQVDSLPYDQGQMKVQAAFGNYPFFMSGDPATPQLGYGENIDVNLDVPDPGFQQQLTIPARSRKSFILTLGYADDLSSVDTQKLSTGKSSYPVNFRLNFVES